MAVTLAVTAVKHLVMIAAMLHTEQEHMILTVVCVLRLRYQTKFGKLWDAADKSVKSAEPQPGLEVPLHTVPSGPLEEALATHAKTASAETDSESAEFSEDSESAEGPPQTTVRQGSMFDIFGRTLRSAGSLFPSRKSSVAFPQHEDDLSGTAYQHRDY